MLVGRVLRVKDFVEGPITDRGQLNDDVISMLVSVLSRVVFELLEF